jgi:hypothetical protein
LRQFALALTRSGTIKKLQNLHSKIPLVASKICVSGCECNNYESSDGFQFENDTDSAGPLSIASRQTTLLPLNEDFELNVSVKGLDQVDCSLRDKSTTSSGTLGFRLIFVAALALFRSV